MPDCTRCGRQLPLYSFHKICQPCRTAMAQYAAMQESYGDPVPRLTDPDAKLYVTVGLLAINVIVFAAMIFSGANPMGPSTDILKSFGGSWGSASLFEQPWRLLTAVFVHGGIIHIAFNMWCLWDLGGLAERVFDRWIYLLVYLSCGLAGSLAAVWWNPRALTVGASGAIFGIAGALISALYLGNLPVSRTAIQSTLKSLLTFAGYNLFFGAIVPHISNSAHVGGFIVGLALGAVLSPSMTTTAAKRQMWALAVFVGTGVVLWGGFTFVRHSHADLMSMDNGIRMLDGKHGDEAVRYFEAVVAKDPKNDRALVLLGNAYLEKKQYEKAAEILQRALGINPYDPYGQYCLGWSQLKLGRNQQAVETLEKAVSLDPNDAEAEATLGQAYQVVGNKTAADTAFRRVEELKKIPSPKI